LFCLVFPCFSYELSRIDSAVSSPNNANQKLLNLVFVEISPVSQRPNSIDITAFLKKLKATSPFDEFADTTAAWQIKLSGDDALIFFKTNEEFPYLSVGRDFLDSLAAKIKQPFKLVVFDNTKAVKCAEISSIEKTSIIILGKSVYSEDEEALRSFLHELGHSLGLRDEGVNSYACAPGPPNCAPTKEDAVKWWGLLVKGSGEINYFSGCCGNMKYICPTAQSLMNNINASSSYGLVNESYLRDVLSHYCNKD